jgi:hypothetical protein
MQRLLAINLLGFYDLYLIVTFVLGITRRYRQYQALVGLILACGQRWPKLVQLVSQHRTIFLTWPTLAPIGMTFVLMAINTLAYNFIWTEARVTLPDLGAHRAALVPFLVFGGVMVFLDLTGLFARWDFDRSQIEKDLDQAEYWLRSWVSPALRVLTLGYVDPKAMVDVEVRKALLAVNTDLNKMFWRWALLIAMRLAFGLTLWLTWAIVVREAASGG